MMVSSKHHRHHGVLGTSTGMLYMMILLSTMQSCQAFQGPDFRRHLAKLSSPSSLEESGGGAQPLFTATADAILTTTSSPTTSSDATGSLTSTLAEGTPTDEIVLSWEVDVADEIRRALAQRSTSDKQQQQPYMVGLVGGPGSGKTTSCQALSELLSDVGCLVMPFDGYHIPLADLQAHPNAAVAADLVYRRGAPDTFDAQRLQTDLRRIRFGDESKICLPGFCHERGDPEPDQHKFRRSQHQVVLVEGLYLLHDEDDEWRHVKELFDWSVFVSTNVDLAVQRLKVRNQCIPGYTAAEIEERCEVVDRANAMTVERSKVWADHVVESAAQRTVTTTIADGTPESDIQVSWEAAVAAQIRAALEEEQDNDDSSSSSVLEQQPFMMSLVGGPGCGKTTSCHVLSELLSDLGVFVLPFDGYHVPLAQLRQQPNAEDLIYRRGAPDTFDADKLQTDLDRIRNGAESVVSIPGFDHAVGDPAEHEHRFERGKHKIVLCEGLYLLHDEQGWETCKDWFDYNIFVNSDVDACIDRLKVRNKCIPGYTEEEIEKRCELVDRTNAMTVERTKDRADLVVESVAQATAAATS